ncbi:MAG: hypothetical protein ABIG68_07925 [Acidobacteriota bacterium]
MVRFRNHCSLALLWISLSWGAAGALAQAEQVIPHVADGAGIIRTKIDIANASPNMPISRMKIFFYRADGTPWTVSSNLGVANEFMIFLGRNHTMRLETLAASEGLVSGYAVIRSTEGNPAQSVDLRVSMSVFYEVLSGSTVIDAVSVPNGRPTLHWMFPAQYDVYRYLFAGLALVNLSGENNAVTLQLWNANPPYVADASSGGTTVLTLKPNEKVARYLHESTFFPDRTAFQGVLVGTSQKPVAVVALLQTPTPSGPQYSTLAAEYRDAMHTEGYVYLGDGQKLDVDVPQVHYVTMDDSGSLDLYYRFVSSTVRKLAPQNGARLAALGVRTLNELNTLTLDQLRALSYGAGEIDMSDISGNMIQGFTFAVQTALGRYAKVRIGQVVSYGDNKDLALQIYVYR